LSPVSFGSVIGVEFFPKFLRTLIFKDKSACLS
jgi:hypothetical protein